MNYRFCQGLVQNRLKNFKINIQNINDLLTYYPFRYEDFESKSIYDLQDGEKAVVVGEVVSPANVQYYGYKRNRLRFQ